MPWCFRAIVVALSSILAACAQAPDAGGRATAQTLADPRYPSAWPTVPEAQVVPAMLALADREWRTWGGRTVYLGSDRNFIETAGHDLWEHERQAFRPVAGYWRAVGVDYWQRAFATTPSAADAANDIAPTAYGRLRIEDAPWYIPWSAVFVSWIVRMAGVPEQEFPSSDAHHDYVADIIRRFHAAAAAGPAALAQLRFVPHEIGAYPPKLGDFVCATRGSAPLQRYDDLLGGRRPMHCDLIVGIDESCGPVAGGRCGAAIGGNVAQAVTRTVFPLASDGNVLRHSPLDGASLRRDWIVTIENRYPPMPHASSPIG